MKPKRKRDWVGRKVKSLRPLKNGLYRIPEGTLFTVYRNFSGLHLEADPCPHCGVNLFIRGVRESDVVLIEEEPAK